jgi:hypothetical protein
MTKSNITIAVLVVLIVILCALSYAGKPLFTGQYLPDMKTLIEGFGDTYIGDKIILHYLHRIENDIPYAIGPAYGLTPESGEMTYLLLAGRLFAALVALTAFIASTVLFVINRGQLQKEESVSKSKIAVIVALVIVAGTLIRLIFAGVMYGNFDMQSYDMVTNIYITGHNVYATTDRYNYSPVWLWVLYALKQVKFSILHVPFNIVVKLFLCCVDLLTVGVLLSIARIQKLPVVGTAIFFYLNPISYLVTGYHGQFENFAMLMVLIGIFMYLRFSARPVLGTTLLWLFATAGMIVKHNTFYELIICLQSSIKRYRIKLSLFAVSVVIFLLLFIPYWKTGSKEIIEHVFKYGSFSGVYGLTSLVAIPQLKYLFILGMFIFPLFLKSSDIIARCLLGVLFFLTFTTGFAAHYFVLPLALGALRPTRFFLLYTAVVSLLVLGNDNNVFIPGLHLLRLNIGWVAVICWFTAEMWSDRQGISSEIAASKKDK